MNRTMFAVGAMLVSGISVACSAPAEDEATGASGDAVTLAPLAVCQANPHVNVRTQPTTESYVPKSFSGGESVSVYCSTHGQRPQPGWSDMWIGMRREDNKALEYMHISTLSCATAGVDLQQIRDCSTVTDAPSVAANEVAPAIPQPPSSASPPTKETGGKPPPEETATPTASLVTSVKGDVFLRELVKVGRLAPGTIHVSGVWTAFGVKGNAIGIGKCNPRDYVDASGPYDFICKGEAADAVRFTVKYSATHPGTLSR